jgi:hypothetical protein
MWKIILPDFNIKRRHPVYLIRRKYCGRRQKRLGTAKWKEFDQ